MLYTQISRPSFGVLLDNDITFYIKHLLCICFGSDAYAVYYQMTIYNIHKKKSAEGGGGERK